MQVQTHVKTSKNAKNIHFVTCLEMPLVHLLQEHCNGLILMLLDLVASGIF